MPCAPLYLENSDKARFSDPKKRINNNYVLNKVEFPRTINLVHSLLLNYQPNYNSNRKSKSKGVSNELMFAHNGENRFGEGKKGGQTKPPHKP